MKPLTKLQVKKILLIWLFAIIINSIIVFFIKDPKIKYVLILISFTIAPIPIWTSMYFIFNEKVAITKFGRHIPNFKTC